MTLTQNIEHFLCVISGVMCCLVYRCLLLFLHHLLGFLSFPVLLVAAG